MLTIADLNQVIKYYAIRIQQRIQEIHHIFTVGGDPPDQQDYDFISLVAKYAHYTTTDDREVRLAKKLAERVLQIFDFFKGKSNSQNLLGVIQMRIEKDLQVLLSVIPLKLGQIFSYIHLLTRRGCIVKPPAQKKRVVSRPILKQVKAEQKAPTFSFFNMQKRATSAIVSNKHLRVNTNPSPIALPAQKLKTDDALALWSGMDIDRGHFVRVRDGNQHILLKDALKRNERLLLLTKKKQKRKPKRTATEFSQQCPILMEVKTNALKTGWSKKRRLGLISRKKHNSIKQNVSFLV